MKILELEKKIKLTNPLMKDVRTGLIRKAVSIRLSLGDKAFFDAVREQFVKVIMASYRQPER